MKTLFWRFRSLSLFEKLHYVLLFIFITSLIPILHMGLYAHPVGDDYTYGMAAHFAWEETGSLIAVIRAAGEAARDFWHSYQGPFASAFFMALHPAVISERLYALTPAVMLFMLILSTSIFLHVLLVKYFGVRRLCCRLITCVLLLLSVQLLEAPSEAFYWYCGAVHYIFMHSCMLLLLSCLLLAFLAEKRSRRSVYLALSLPLAVCCGGANFVTALASVILLCCLMSLCLILKKKQELFLSLPTALVTFFCFFLNVTAPGNAVREADQLAGLSPLPAIYYAFQYCLQYMGKWFNIYVAAALLLLIPVIWAAASQLNIRLRLPGLFSLFSFCLLSAMFAPSTYALGLVVIYGRTLNIIMQTYYLLLVLNLCCWIGWFRQQLTAEAREAAAGFSRTLALLFRKYAGTGLLCLGLFLVFAVFCSDKTQLTTKAAVHDLRKGYAQAYHEETLHRIALLSTEGADEVWVPNYTVRPYLLDLEDISEDSSHWRNQALAKWYGKKIVHLSVIY